MALDKEYIENLMNELADSGYLLSVNISNGAGLIKMNNEEIFKCKGPSVNHLIVTFLMGMVVMLRESK